MPGIYLETLSWPEAEEALRRAPTVLVPVGARCKEHGLHLPLNTDWLMAEYLTHRIVEQCSVLALPTLQYGFYPAFVEYPGSVTLRRETFRDLVCEICHSLWRHGAGRFYVLNTGISTNRSLEPARLALDKNRIRMDFTDLTEILADIRVGLEEQKRGSHADELETSEMLYIRPTVVRLERARKDDQPRRGPGPLTRDPLREGGIFSPTGAWGDPTLADRAKGEVLVEALVEKLIADIRRLEEPQRVARPPRKAYL